MTVTLARDCGGHDIYTIWIFTDSETRTSTPQESSCLGSVYTHYTGKDKTVWIVPFFPPFCFPCFCGATSCQWSLKVKCSAKSRGQFPSSAPSAYEKTPTGSSVKWNTPFGFHWRRPGSRSGCWKGNLGCPPAWRPSLPDSGTSLFSGRGIWPLSPGRPRPQRSPPLSHLPERGTTVDTRFCDLRIKYKTI